MKPQRLTEDELNSQLETMFPKGEPDLTPSDTGSPSNEGTQNEEAKESTTEEAGEKMIPESRYHHAVVAMNKAQQECAVLRKENESLKQQLGQPASSTQMNELGAADEQETDMQDIFPEVLAYLKAKVLPRLDALESKSGDFENVANDYKGYRQEQHNSQFWTAIREAHPDMEQYLALPNTPYEDLNEQQKQYSDWYAEQDDVTKSMLSDPDPMTVNNALDMFYGSLPEKSFEPPEFIGSDGYKRNPSVKPEPATDVIIAVGATKPKPSKLEQAKAEGWNSSEARSHVQMIREEMGRPKKQKVEKAATPQQHHGLLARAKAVLETINEHDCKCMVCERNSVEVKILIDAINSVIGAIPTTEPEAVWTLNMIWTPHAAQIGKQR